MRLLAAGLRWLHSATRVPARSAPRLFRAAAASFARPLPVVLSVAGALGLGLSVLALTPGSPGRPPQSVVGASLQPVTLGSAEAAHAYDSVPPGTVDGDGAAGPEGAIAEAEQVLAAPADAVSSSASRFGMPLTAWYAVTDRYGAPRGPGIVHGGIDLDVRGYSRSPIYAACDGIVASTGYSSSYGYHAIVDCGDGWATLYGHMSTILASPGNPSRGANPSSDAQATADSPRASTFTSKSTIRVRASTRRAISTSRSHQGHRFQADRLSTQCG